LQHSPKAARLAYFIGHAHVGRRRLALLSGLTEMATRTEVQRLYDQGLVRTGPRGIDLTPAGRRRFAAILTSIRALGPLGLPSLQLDRVTLGAHLFDGRLTPAWTLRDIAIREGATALLVLRFATRKWCFAHDGEPLDHRNPADASAIRQRFPAPEEGDSLLLASAPDPPRAAAGLWGAISTVLPLDP